MNGVPVNPIKWIPMYRTRVWTSIIRDEWKITSRGKNHYVHYIRCYLYPSFNSDFFFPLTEFNPLGFDLPRRWRTSLYVRTCFVREQKCKQSSSARGAKFLIYFFRSAIVPFMYATGKTISRMREWKVGFISRRKYFSFEEYKTVFKTVFGRVCRATIRGNKFQCR